MIKIELIAPDALKIVVPDRLNADDFRQLTPQVELHHQTAR